MPLGLMGFDYVTNQIDIQKWYLNYLLIVALSQWHIKIIPWMISNAYEGKHFDVSKSSETGCFKYFHSCSAIVKIEKSSLTREINSIFSVKHWISISPIYNYHPVIVQSTPGVMNFSRSETSKVQYKLCTFQGTIKSFQYKQSRLQDKCSRDCIFGHSVKLYGWPVTKFITISFQTITRSTGKPLACHSI